MDFNIKQRWLRALRSDEYKQGNGCLNPSPGHYCCLGVLTDLAIKDGVLKGWSDMAPDHMACRQAGSLPDVVVHWAKLPRSLPLINDPNLGVRGLDGLNDIERFSFREIADLIETNLLR